LKHFNEKYKPNSRIKSTNEYFGAGRIDVRWSDSSISHRHELVMSYPYHALGVVSRPNNPSKLLQCDEYTSKLKKESIYQYFGAGRIDVRWSDSSKSHRHELVISYPYHALDAVSSHENPSKLLQCDEYMSELKKESIYQYFGAGRIDVRWSDSSISHRHELVMSYPYHALGVVSAPENPS